MCGLMLIGTSLKHRKPQGLRGAWCASTSTLPAFWVLLLYDPIPESLNSEGSMYMLFEPRILLEPSDISKPPLAQLESAIGLESRLAVWSFTRIMCEDQKFILI